MPDKNIYFDNNATTPIADEVRQIMIDTMDLYGNPSSMHGPGRAAANAISWARSMVAKLLGAQEDEIIFTAGGSESNNTVLHLVQTDIFSGSGRNRIVTSSIEHPSIYETVKVLQKEGVAVTLVGVDRDGLLKMDELEAAMGPDVAIVSVMMANNEIGTIQNIQEIAAVAKQHGALMHTDAVQAVGKIPIDVNFLGIDMLSLSGHKIYGPKGIGVLYVKKGVPFSPYILGGHQEDARRAGTYNTTGIIALGKAAELARKELVSEAHKLEALRNRLKEGIISSIPNVKVNGHPEKCLPGTLNVSFPGAEGESILLYLDLEGIAVSTGSACATGSLEPSYVLLETGLGAELAHGSIRFSLGKYNTREEVEYVINKLPPIIKRLREMSTL